NPVVIASNRTRGIRSSPPTPSPPALNQSHLLWIRLRSTVPRLIEIGHGRAIAEWSRRRRRHPGAIMREPAHFFEHRPAIRGKAHADDRADLLMQCVDRAIGMRPAIGERLRIERA